MRPLSKEQEGRKALDKVKLYKPLFVQNASVGRFKVRKGMFIFDGFMEPPTYDAIGRIGFMSVGILKILANYLNLEAKTLSKLKSKLRKANGKNPVYMYSMLSILSHSDLTPQECAKMLMLANFYQINFVSTNTMAYEYLKKVHDKKRLKRGLDSFTNIELYRELAEYETSRYPERILSELRIKYTDEEVSKLCKMNFMQAFKNRYDNSCTFDRMLLAYKDARRKHLRAMKSLIQMFAKDLEKEGWI